MRPWQLLLLTGSIVAFVAGVALLPHMVHFVVAALEPGVWQSPRAAEQLSEYYNLVFRASLLISCALFLGAVQPWLRSSRGWRRMTSLGVSLLLLPVYLVLLYVCASTLHKLG